MAKTNAIEPKTIVNRKARFEYELMDTWEAGVVLVGSEVKSVWGGRVNMIDAFCRVMDGEMWILELDIESYDHATAFKPERRRNRKLLLHRKEIEIIQRKATEKGFTIIPSKIYFSKGRVKIEIAVARGKKHYDKRQQLANDDARREMERMRSEKF